jgi:hypothetical protein
MKKAKVKQVSKLNLLSASIEWENWHDDEAEQSSKNTAAQIYFPVSGVVYSRLQWLKEQIASGDIEIDEALETIEMAQVMVDGVKDNDLYHQKINPSGFKYL